MSLKPFFSCVFLFVATLCSLPVMAQTASEKGTANVTYSGWSVSATDRQIAMRKAEVNALERYIADSNAAKSRIFDSKRDQIAAHIDDYILGTTQLSGDSDKHTKTYSVVIRADINVNRLMNDIGTGSASTAQADSGSHGVIMFLFTARSQSSVQNFDSRVSRRTDTDSTAVKSTDEGEAVHVHEVNTHGGRSDHTSNTVTTGGSTLTQADKVSWVVANASEIDTSMTGVFSDAGYDVVEADQVEGASGGMVNIAKIREAYSHGNDLQSNLMYSTTQGAQRAGVDYLAMGTLDVGMPDQDPVSGGVRVFVVVTGKVIAVKGQFARIVASIGPVQYAGLGPDASVARVNALKAAAEQASRQMVDALVSKSIH